MALKLRERSESLGPRTDAQDVVGSCTIVELVPANPGEESKYIVLYENKEPPGRPEARKNGFPFGGIEAGMDKTTWNNAARELLEEAFCAAIPELQQMISKLQKDLETAETYETTADSPETIRKQIADTERKLAEAKNRAAELFDTLAKHPEIATCKRVIDRFNALAEDPEHTNEKERKVAALLDALVAEDDYICEFSIRNERGFGILHFIVFAIQMPMEVKLTPGEEQIQAEKLMAAEIEGLNGFKEFFYHQYVAWANFKAIKGLR